MSLNLKLLRGYKNVYSLLKPQTLKTNFSGRSAMAAKHNVLFSPQSTTTIINQQRTSATAASSNAGAPVSHTASLHWNVERALSVAMLAILPASFIIESTATDYLLAASLALHAHWGLQSIVTDYVHGKTLPKIAQFGLYFVSILAFSGLCYFNYTDIGLTKAVKKIWTL